MTLSQNARQRDQRNKNGDSIYNNGDSIYTIMGHYKTFNHSEEIRHDYGLGH